MSPVPLANTTLNIVSVPLPFVPLRFDAQIVRLITGNERFLFINIYRPPHYIEASFFDELSDFYDATTNLSGHPVLLGDINCLGNTPDTYDVRLSAWLSCYDLITVTDGPTRMHHDGSLSRLDLIAQPSERRSSESHSTQH